MIVSLPIGAQVTSIDFYFLALAGGWYETQPNVDLQWALILPPSTLPAGNSIQIKATLKNWSESATRQAYMLVGWHLPH
jgi:hypothetical protein